MPKSSIRKFKILITDRKIKVANNSLKWIRTGWDNLSNQLVLVYNLVILFYPLHTAKNFTGLGVFFVNISFSFIPGYKLKSILDTECKSVAKMAKTLGKIPQHIIQ